jgi:phytoene desaturase
MKKKIAIIGAGVGGLSAACRLARFGYEVEVFEKLPRCGGRNNILEERGFKFDTGPSFVLMPDFFSEVFSYCQEDINDYLDLRTLEINYKIFFPDGDSLVVHKDPQKTIRELERIEPGSSRGFEAFIKETAEIYREVKPLLYRCFTLGDAFRPSSLKLIGKIRVFDTYWKLARRFFKSEKLCFAFTFEAMFMGVSPFDAPAFYSIITYADHMEKIRHPMGGMYQIPLALEKMAKKFGARFFYGQQITGLYKEKGLFVLNSAAGKTTATHTIINADYAYAQSELLKRRIPEYNYSCSVYLVYLGLKKKIKGLEHHNLFFSGDIKKNLREIFKEKAFPRDPSFYVHVPTVTDPSLAPEGKEILYLLIPVPNSKDFPDNFSACEKELKDTVFNKIKQVIGEELQPLIEIERRFYPQDFISRYNIKHAATFGLAHNLMQSAFLRPANFDRKLKNLYFVGASTQPGGGLPVVIAGSRIVADLINSRG